MKKYTTNREKFSNNKPPLSKRIHPGIKFFCFIIAVIFIFLANSFFTQLIFASFILVLYFSCNIGRKNFKAMIKTLFIMFFLFTIINWIFYKNPISFDTTDFSHIGSWSVLNQYQWAYHYDLPSDHGIYVSDIYGGDVIGAINQEVFEKFRNSLDNNYGFINSWINKNHVDIAKLTNLPAFITSEDDKKIFLYMMNNKFTLDGVKYATYMVHSLNPGSGIQDNIIYNPIYSILYTTNWYTLSPTAFIRATYISIKIFSILLVSAMLTETTTSVELSVGLETMLSPLKIVKFPVNEAATIIAVAIRFIPSLLSESRRILNAQASRGVDFNNGNLLTKIKALVSLVVPLFSIAFKNSDELANAMDARGYDPKAYRTKYRVYHFSGYDFTLLLLVTLFGTFVTAVKYLNVFFVFFGVAEGDLAF